MNTKFDSVTVVKLHVPPAAPRLMELKVVDSPFTCYRANASGTKLVACGYDYGRAAQLGHRPLPQQQQKQGTTPSGKSKPAKPPGGAFKFEDYAPPPEQGENGAKMEPLTFRRPSEILAMEFSDEDFVLRNGYLTKGEPAAICGAGGIGKSRIAMQLARDLITGRPFLGRWPTNGANIRVLILQTENTCRRLKSDLCAQMSVLAPAERQRFDDHCVFHTLENSDDSFLNLANAENQQRIEAAIAAYKPDLIVWDVLRDFVTDDPNSDRDMQATLSLIGRLTRKHNPKCIALILHHGRTGKAGAASATGFDRGSFARNSKVLFSCVRALINVAPYTPDNAILLIASGKCNNAEEFQPFAVRLNTRTMSYEPDESITPEDIEAWQSEMAGGNGAGAKRKNPKTKEDLLKLVPDFGDIAKNLLEADAHDVGIGEKKFSLFYTQLIHGKEIFQHLVKRSGMPDERRVSRSEHHASRDAAA